MAFGVGVGVVVHVHVHVCVMKGKKSLVSMFVREATFSSHLLLHRRRNSSSVN